VLDRLAVLPEWRGHAATANATLDLAQHMGVLTRLDPDSGLSPLHESFADFLAARAIARGETGLPAKLNTPYDEAMLFLVEIAGVDDRLADRLAAENPLLACRAARLRGARGQAGAEPTGRLLPPRAGTPPRQIRGTSA
jgi:hypothetical protein